MGNRNWIFCIVKCKQNDAFNRAVFIGPAYVGMDRPVKDSGVSGRRWSIVVDS